VAAAVLCSDGGCPAEKNAKAKDQRKAGMHKDQASDDHLIFCHHKTQGSGAHHVALFRDEAVWHARLEHGVVRQTWEEFNSIYEIEEIVSVCDNSTKRD